MPFEHHELTPLYNEMWRNAQPALQRGAIEIDETLAREQPDARRGLTLLLHPSNEVITRITALLHELRALEPEQHYYKPNELHVTALSLFTAVVAHQPFFDQEDRYVAAARAAVQAVAPFVIDFHGLTASRAAVLVQGFPRGDGLALLRDRLRQALNDASLGQGLDQRYRLRSAHSTVLRFRAPLREPQAFVERIARYRQHPFGTATVTKLLLVANDWYMSQGVTRVIEEFAVQ